MKSCLFLIAALFTITSLSAQTECTVKIVYSLNKSNPPSYNFKTDPQVTGVKYYWSFGDNTYSDAPAPTHAYAKTGSYLVQFKVLGADNKVCYGELKAQFEGGTAITEAVTLAGKGKVRKTGTDACGVSITMDNGKVLVPTAESVQFAYTDGQYVELAYQLPDKPSGCSFGVAAKIIKIAAINTVAPCTVKIVTVKNSTNPVSYTFKTDPRTEGAKYYWKFGDNTTGDGATPTHTFAKSGTYPVVVQVTGPDGKICYGELRAEFAGTATTEVTTLSGKGKVKKTGTDACGVSITMDNGKVLVPTAESVQFSYMDGQYVELAYQLPDKPSGCSFGVAAKIIKIAAINTVAPCTVKIVTVKNSTNPVSYTFKTDPQTEGAKYYWKFGDNTTGDGATPTHTYAKSGTYPVVVQVTGPDGKICYGELRAEFAGTATTVVTTLSGKGKVRKTGTDACGVSITMDNGKVLVPTAESVQFSYVDGQYVELAYQLPEKPSGCTFGVAAKIINIAAINTVVPCTVKIVTTKNNTTPASYTFKTDPVNTTTGTKYYWYFGDNTSAESPSPTHTYSKEGSYLVQVKVLGTDNKVCYGELKAQFAGGTATSTVTLPTCKGQVNLLLIDPTEKDCNGSATVKLQDEKGLEIPNVKYKWLDGRTGSSVGNLCPEKVYIVQSVVENVCQKITSFTLLSQFRWTTTTLNGQNNFTVNAPVEGVLYEWNFGDGTVLTGPSVNYNFQKDGVYDVTLKAVSGNGTLVSSQPVVVMQNIAKTELSGQPIMEIYPNPVKETLSVDFKNSGEEKLTFEIKNMAGQVVYKNQINNDGSSHTDINVQNLNTGMYVLRIYGGQKTIGDRKFIKTN